MRASTVKVLRWSGPSSFTVAYTGCCRPLDCNNSCSADLKSARLNSLSPSAVIASSSDSRISRMMNSRVFSSPASRYIAAITASIASESSVPFDRPPLRSSPRPSRRYCPSPILVATLTRCSALTRCAFSFDSWPSWNVGNFSNNNWLVTSPRTASPRNSNCSLSCFSVGASVPLDLDSSWAWELCVSARSSISGCLNVCPSADCNAARSDFMTIELIAAPWEIDCPYASPAPTAARIPLPPVAEVQDQNWQAATPAVWSQAPPYISFDGPAQAPDGTRYRHRAGPWPDRPLSLILSPLPRRRRSSVS